MESIWNCAELILCLPIAEAIIIAAVNIAAFSHGNSAAYAQKTVLHETQAQETVTKDTLYIEETCFSGAELPLYEISQDEPTGGYLVTSEMAMLAQLVQAEAGNQDLKGKRLVADVVLNRVDSDKFPNAIEEVIFQKNHVQFSVIVGGAFERAGGYIGRMF